MTDCSNSRRVSGLPYPRSCPICGLGPCRSVADAPGAPLAAPPPRKPLSGRAQKLLGRIRRGEFYEAYSPKLPKAMAELVEAGLVATAGRPVLVVACYVPAKGYTPYQPERFEP